MFEDLRGRIGMCSFGTKEECWSLVPKLEQDYFVVMYCIAIYLLADSIIYLLADSII
jgi:hypothetical protein